MKDKAPTPSEKWASLIISNVHESLVGNKPLQKGIYMVSKNNIIQSYKNASSVFFGFYKKTLNELDKNKKKYELQFKEVDQEFSSTPKWNFVKRNRIADRAARIQEKISVCDELIRTFTTVDIPEPETL